MPKALTRNPNLCYCCSVLVEKCGKMRKRQARARRHNRCRCGTPISKRFRFCKKCCKQEHIIRYGSEYFRGRPNPTAQKWSKLAPAYGGFHLVPVKAL